MLRSYKPEDLSEEDRLSQQILEYYWEMNIFLRYDDEDFYIECQYPVDQVRGVHISFIDFMLNTHEINNLEDAVDYLERLKKGRTKLRQASDNLPPVHRSPPSFILEKVMLQIQDFIKPSVEDNLFYKDFVYKAERASNMPLEAQKELKDDLKSIIEFDIIPAYQRLYDDLKILYGRQLAEEEAKEMPYSPSLMNVSVQKTAPNGERYEKPVGYFYYTGIMKYHMGVHYNKEVNTDSLAMVIDDEIYRLQEELAVLLDSAGFPVQDSLGAAFMALSTQDSLSYSSVSAQEMFGEIRDQILEANQEAKDIFGYQAQPLEISSMVTHRVPFTSRFFYYPSSLDEYRRAKLFINFDSLQRMPRFQLPVMIRAYTSPGLHFLKTIQHSNDHLPTFRRAIIGIEAYNKGWTFYAQRMLNERGVYNTLHEQIGYLHWELLQATRLMADYYIHGQMWTRDDVIAYVSKTAGIPRWEAAAMVDWVVVEPGKAFAYWTGYQKIKSLKAMAVEALGNQFNLKEFHQVLLECGPVPMYVLEQEVGRYIDRNKPNDAPKPLSLLF